VPEGEKIRKQAEREGKKSLINTIDPKEKKEIRKAKKKEWKEK
jgi:hypothetical protein